MILSVESDEGCSAVQAAQRPPSPAVEARQGPAPAGLDDLLAMCRALCVGTGLLWACRMHGRGRPDYHPVGAAERRHGDRHGQAPPL